MECGLLSINSVVLLSHNSVYGNTSPSVVNNGFLKISQNKFDWMDPQMDVSSLASLLRRCSNSKALSEGRTLHSYIVQRGFYHERFLQNSLVQMYGCCGCLDDACSVFDKIWLRNSHSWTILMAACAENGQGTKVVDLFNQMQAESIRPNKVTFICVLDACASLAALADGVDIHASIVASGCELDVVVGNALVNMYGKCGSLDNAKTIFGTMQQRDVISWNAIITACVHNIHGTEALAFFHQMQLDGIRPDEITFICVLDACVCIGALKEGQEIHASIIHNRCESHVTVGTVLVNMYGKCRRLEDARIVFGEIRQRDVISWNAMISACAQNDDGEEALKLFRSMQAEGFKPTRITFVGVLDACSALVALEEGQHIHAAILCNGFWSDVMVGSALINMYDKCGNLDCAMGVFAQLPQRNVVSWNTMISACVHNWSGKEALDLFHQLSNHGVKPDEVSFICALDACAILADVAEGQRIHASIVSMGFLSDVVVGTALINMYSKCGRPIDAKAVFEGMPQLNVVSWNCIITACSENGHCKEALDLYSRMQAENVETDKITFLCVLDACGSLAALAEGQKIHSNITERSFEQDVIVANALINMYGRCGSLSNARKVFNEMQEKDAASWNSIISACAQNGNAKEAIQRFFQMQAEGFKPDRITFICILTGCSCMGLLDDGRYHFVSMIKDFGIAPMLEHYVCMVELLGRAGQLEEAEDLIQSMPFKHVPSVWLSLLSACRLHGDVECGVRATKHVLELDSKNAAAYILLANIHAAADRWNDVEKFKQIMINNGIKKELVYSCVRKVPHETFARDMADP